MRTSVELLETRRLLATFTVTTASDLPAQPGTSLREAVALANAAAGQDTITFDPIAFPNSPTHVPTTIALQTQPSGGSAREIVFTDTAPTTVRATPGARVAISGIDALATAGTRLVSVGANANVDFFNVDFVDGRSATATSGAGGGAILAAAGARLGVRDCSFTDNTATVPAGGGTAGGGAIGVLANAVLNVERCTFTGNRALATGGGAAPFAGSAIFAPADASAFIADSHFAGNGAGLSVVQFNDNASGVIVDGASFVGAANAALFVTMTSAGQGLSVLDSTFEGGAIVNASAEPLARAAIVVSLNGPGSSSAPVRLVNTTISGNAYVGLSLGRVPATVTHSTIVDNTTALATAAGILAFSVATPITLKNSLVAGNVATGTPTPTPKDIGNTDNSNAVVVTGTNNVVGSPGAGTAGGLTNGVNGNRVGTGSSPNLNLPLATIVRPLGDNGGDVRTHAVLTTGRAYNAGSAANAAGVALDARGQPFARVANGLPDAGAYEVQTITPPRVSEARFDADGVNAPGFPHRLELRFETPIDAASLTADDLTLTNLTTDVPASSIRVDYEPVASRATFAFTGFVGAVLPDGNYRATLPAGSVSDVAGTAQVEAYTIDFTVLAADANGDRSVTFTDLLTLAQNYGTSGHIFSEGNFNYDPDGLVNFDDLLVLSQQYNRSLLMMPLAAGTLQRATLADDGGGKRQRTSDNIFASANPLT